MGWLWLVVGKEHCWHCSWEYSSVCVPLEVAILRKSAPIYQHWEAPGWTIIQVGTQPHPSVKRLPKATSGTQPPPISHTEKAPPTRGIGIRPTYQWSGTSPSLGSLQQGPIPTLTTRQVDTRSKRGYSSIVRKKDTTPKTYKNEKTENYNSDKGERKKKQKNS